MTRQRGLDNTPPENIVPVLRETALKMEDVRSALGHPIVVNSGYRSQAVNRAVGGAKNSAHIAGDAVDFICPSFGAPHEVCKAIENSGIAFDQLILEYGWTHISFAPAMRRQVLTKTSDAAPLVPGIAA